MNNPTAKLEDKMIVRDITGYRTSRDYEKLWRIAQHQSAICIVDFGDLYVCRDVAHTIYDGKRVSISARGVCYLDANNLGDFSKLCEKWNVEFIEPNE